jgi:PAS domain S-box-containing protein
MQPVKTEAMGVLLVRPFLGHESSVVLAEALALTPDSAQNEAMMKKPSPTRKIDETWPLRPMEHLFDRVSDTVFFIKDAQGRYAAVNQTLVRRLGKRTKAELIGRSAAALFPPHLAQRIEAQDNDVLRLGRSIRSELELHLYPDGEQGWCLTWKEPLRDAAGRIAGLAGISRDLKSSAIEPADTERISRVIDYVRRHIDQPLRVSKLAAHAKLSPWRLDQRMRTFFGISLAQYVTRARIDAACAQLRQTPEPISAVALSCGYGDQAAFTRQFRKCVGLTPRSYRVMAKGED